MEWPDTDIKTKQKKSKASTSEETTSTAKVDEVKENEAFAEMGDTLEGTPPTPSNIEEANLAGSPEPVQEQPPETKKAGAVEEVSVTQEPDSPSLEEVMKPELLNEKQKNEPVEISIGSDPAPSTQALTTEVKVKPEPVKVNPKYDPSEIKLSSDPAPSTQALTTEVNFEDHFVEGQARGSLNMDANNLNIPRWDIVQKTSNVVDENPNALGKIHISINNTFCDEIELLVVDFIENRRRFKKDEKGSPIYGERPLCYSEDGQLNAGGEKYDTPFSVKCNTCPDYLWDNKKPPECDPFHNYLVVDVGSLNQGGGIPAKLSFKRTQTKRTTKFNTELSSKRTVYKGTTYSAPFYFNVYSLKPVLFQVGKYSTYIPEFTWVRESTPEEINLCLQLSKKSQDIKWSNLRNG